MLSVLLTTVVSTTSVRSALLSQYYTMMAKSAAQSGLEYAKSCLRSNGDIPQWSQSQPLKPNTDCNGAQLSGFSCSENSIDSRCSVLVDDNSIIASFSVGYPATGSGGKASEIMSVGTVKLLRNEGTNQGTVWRQFTYTSKLKTAVSDGTQINY